MATRKIADLTQATTASDADLMVIQDTSKTKKITFATLLTSIKSKLGVGTAANLNTTSKEIVGAINEINTNLERSTSTCTKGGNVSVSSVTVYKSGNWISLNGTIQTNDNYNFAAWNPQTVLTVPTGYRPYTKVYFLTNINGTNFSVTVDTTGIVNLQNMSATDIKTGTSTYITIFALYITV